MTLEISSTAKDSIQELKDDFRDLSRFKVLHISTLKNNLVIELIRKDQGFGKYIIELLNMIGSVNTSIENEEPWSYDIRFDSSQAESFSNRMKNQTIREYPQLLIWDAKDKTVPKFTAVAEKIKITMEFATPN